MIQNNLITTRSCTCAKFKHPSKRLVITGGPGAGKTAILEMARRQFCDHIAILPEAAGIVFGGGFWREKSKSAKEAAQRAIFHVQREMENLAEAEKRYALVLCDRGTLDGLAYWPTSSKLFFKELGTTHAKELERYSTVIHLRSPSLNEGYNHRNPIRTETALEAGTIDKKIEKAWFGHPNRVIIDSHVNFIQKVEATMRILKDEIPPCCLKKEKLAL